ncbi:PF07075 domain protein [Bacteriovorax sp. DB6_IX]|nr:PF07075 domain protein [Bacteriovorax sp. DB6_IX]
MGQFLCRELYHFLGDKFEWTQKAYEYEYEKLPIDLINGSEAIRHWVEKGLSVEELNKLEQFNNQEFLDRRKKSLLY